MATVEEIFDCLDGRAPFTLQMDFDNAGFLVGRAQREIRCVLVALDITEEVVEEAARLGAGLIVAHHPVIFHPARNLTDRDPTGRRVLALIEQGIAAICAHTNLDAVAGGVNDALALRLGLTGITQLHQDGLDASGAPYGIGRVGLLPEEMGLKEFVEYVKARLGSNGARYASGSRPVRRVAVGGGSCSDMLQDALAEGCDTFVTADVPYHLFLDARSHGLNLIDAGHFPTENVVCPVLCDWLKAGFPELEIIQSAAHQEVLSYR